jgi:hypothetical protein
MKRISLIFLCAFVFFSCDSIVEVEPPFIIWDFAVKKGAEYDEAKTNAEFYFKNTARKSVAAMTVSFRLYYSDGSYPTYGNNKVDVNFAGFIPQLKEELITVPLDSYINIYRSMPLIADQIWVEKIIYNDGSAWKDALGLWQTGGTQ